MLPVIGVDRFHPLLFLLQPCQLRLQLLHSLRVIGADAAPACAADLVQQSLDLPPLRHVGVCGPILFFLFPHREIAAASNQDGRHTGSDGVALIHILRQPAGIGVQQTVYLLMVDGVHHPLLLLRDLGGLIHRLPVGCCGAPRHIVGEADHPFRPAGQFLIDGIIFDGSSPPGNENAVKRVPMNTLHSYRSGTFLFFCRPFATGGGSSSAGGVSERSRPRRLCRAPMFVAVISLTQYRSQGSSSAIRWVRTATSNAVSSSVETYTEYCRRSKPLLSMNRWISL